MKVNPDVTNDNDKGIRISVLLAFFIFIHPCKLLIPYIKKIICRVFHHLLQETGYKKASMSQIMHSSSPS